MDFLIATHNEGKRDEIQRILLPLGFRVLTADELGITLREAEETGKTFEENAMIKALSALEDSQMPCIADDSGLMVDALNGRPGVYTARYGGEELPFPEKISLLLEEMKDVPEDKRGAAFVSVIACVFPNGEKFTVRGECRGKIGFTPSGKDGFGFDPIFTYDFQGEWKSFASLSAEEKDAVSHRGRSLALLREKLKERTGRVNG